MTSSDETFSQPDGTARREPYIRANILLPVADALAAKGLAVEALLDRYIGSWKIHNSYQEIPLQEYLAFFEDAAALAGDPFFGLRLGGRFRPENLGSIGSVFRASRDLHSALARLSSYLLALRPGTVTTLIVDGDYAYWTYEFDFPVAVPHRQDVEFSLAATVGFIRALIGPGWAPLAVHLQHAAPAVTPKQRQLVHTVFQAPVLFNQSANQLIFSSRYLKQADLSGGSATPASLEQQFRKLMAEAAGDESIALQVRYVLAKRLGNAPLTLESVAGELGLSVRTLQRRLAEEKTSLRALIREQRQDAAKALLSRKMVSVSSVAETVGYSDPAVLSRAFKNWTGAAPSRFRNKTE